MTSSAAAGNKLNKRATSVDAGSGQGRGCSEITGSKQIRGHVGDRVQAGIKKKKGKGSLPVSGYDRAVLLRFGLVNH